MLVVPSGNIVYKFTEEGFGDHADPLAVLAECRRWAANRNLTCQEAPGERFAA